MWCSKGQCRAGVDRASEHMYYRRAIGARRAWFGAPLVYLRARTPPVGGREGRSRGRFVFPARRGDGMGKREGSHEGSPYEEARR